MKNNAWRRVREQNKVTLYADNEPYAEYMKRMLSESVQYKLKEKEEENTIEKYMNYDVEDEKEIPKEKADWSEVTTAILVILMDAAIIGAIVFVLYVFFFGG